jgi:hypothetical protein
MAGGRHAISALRQKRNQSAARIISAFQPIADLDRRPHEVGSVPLTESR